MNMKVGGRMITKTEDEIKQIAKDLFHGKIFCDRHLKDGKDIEKVFAVIALGGADCIPEEDRDDVGLIYEYLDKSSPVGINGKPMFFSFNYINKNDTLKVFDYYEKLKEMEMSL
jgi:hypothetical protein